MSSQRDMQFAFPQSLYNKMFSIYKEPHNFGYTLPRKSLWDAINSWVNRRYSKNVEFNDTNTQFWTGIGPLIAAAIHALTKQGQNILIMTPHEYRYISDVAQFNRNAVEVPLIVSNNRYQLDFKALQNTFQTKQIKLFLFMSPWNPCGRIWSYEQLQKLVKLLLKYKIYVMSDEIFSDAVIPPSKFTSILEFPEIFPQLLYTASPTQAINFSGMPCSFSYTANKQIFDKIQVRRLHGFWPSTLTYNLLEVIYTQPQAQQWIAKADDYFQQNYKIFKQKCCQLLPHLQIMDLDCSYLIVIDFKAYKDLDFTRFSQYFTKVNVCPIFIDTCLINTTGTSLVRINLAINQSLVPQLVDRLHKLITIKLQN